MPSRLEPILQRRFITSDDVRAAAARGDGSLVVQENCTVTDEARELALKHSLRLVEERASVVTRAPVTSTAPPSRPAENPVPAHPALPEDLAARVAQAVAAVLQELQLGDRAASLQPIVVRRVFAGLNAARN